MPQVTRQFLIFFSMIMVYSMTSNAQTHELSPPVAKIETIIHKSHGHERQDDYYWLNQRDNPDVIDYLTAENTYTDAKMAHTKKLREILFKEIKGRYKQDDISAPYRFDNYYYYSRFEENKNYPIYCRKKEHLEADEEIILNSNQLAEGHEYHQVGSLKVSPNHRLMGYAMDNIGRRIYELHFMDISTQKPIGEPISDVTANFVWANDNKTVFYTKADPDTLRPYQVYRHDINQSATLDTLVFEELDETFHVHIHQTTSRDMIVIGSYHTHMSEMYTLSANKPEEAPTLFSPKEAHHEYYLDHFRDTWFIRTNKEAQNFRLMQTPEETTNPESWIEIIPHSKSILLETFALFNDYLVIQNREHGLEQLKVIPWNGEPAYDIPFEEACYTAEIGINKEFNTDTLRFDYGSLTTPHTTYDFNLKTKEKSLIKQEKVLGNFKPDNYQAERIFAKAPDGTEIPISLVYRKDKQKKSGNPTLLYGYGSYGHSLTPYFSPSRLSLLDRGFIFAIAHIRGGEDLGREWYESGKLLNKVNTFTDFIACGEHLLQKNYTTPNQLYAMGGSAGGLLVGAVMNMRPELFNGIVAQVPFVDVITTMEDPSIPLTTGEYDEWGDPRDEQYYHYISTYSPYDNVEAKDYPHLLVTTGLHDSQVQYWEPAKWVAKLRRLKTDNHTLLLKTDMHAGHGGGSGRDKQYEEIAFEYAFILDLSGIRQ